MRALIFDKTLSFQSRHPDPILGEGDTLVRVDLAGICGTDLRIIRGELPFIGIPGHEFVGRVEQSTDRRLIGRRVVGEINVACGRCDLCLCGLSLHCRDRSVLGIDGHNGAFAEFLRLPAGNLHPIPDTVEDEQAVFVEPLAAALAVLRQVKLDARTWVTVLGDGRLGLLVAQVLRNAGAPVRVIGKHPEKMRLCEKWSIRSRPLADIVPRHDQDVVVDCTGSPHGFETAMRMVRPRGILVLKSITGAGPLNLTPLVVDEIQVIGSRSGPFREAIQALAGRQVDVTSLIQRRMKFEQGVEAFERAGQPGALKVLLAVS